MKRSLSPRMHRAILFAVLAILCIGGSSRVLFGDRPAIANAVDVRIPRGDMTDLGFPVGWYDRLSLVSSLQPIASSGANAVLPYNSDASVRAYLDAANAVGVRVLLEIPRPYVKSLDRASIATFVATFKSDPGVLGWYLADEPSMNKELGPLTPNDATALYDTIKAKDPTHLVAMDFTSGEPIESYRYAMDVVMFDAYPCWAGRPEFDGLLGWTRYTALAATAASTEHGFFPVLQAYGGTTAAPVFGRRLCSAAEERYLVFSSLQMNSTGLFFWTHYRSKDEWIRTALSPNLAIVDKMRPAIRQGPVDGLVTSSRADVVTTAFRAPDGRTYIVAIHRGAGTAKAVISLHHVALPKAGAVRVLDGSHVDLAGGRIVQRFGPFDVVIYATQ